MKRPDTSKSLDTNALANEYEKIISNYAKLPDFSKADYTEYGYNYFVDAFGLKEVAKFLGSREQFFRNG